MSEIIDYINKTKNAIKNHNIVDIAPHLEKAKSEYPKTLSEDDFDLLNAKIQRDAALISAKLNEYNVWFNAPKNIYERYDRLTHFKRLLESKNFVWNEDSTKQGKEQMILNVFKVHNNVVIKIILINIMTLAPFLLITTWAMVSIIKNVLLT